MKIYLNVQLYTNICPRSLDPSNIVTYFIKKSGLLGHKPIRTRSGLRIIGPSFYLLE